MSPNEIARRLFFIVGCGRSGTTLLKSMLDAHPGIYLPPETFFFSTIRQRFPGGEKASIESKLLYVAQRWWIRDAGIQEQDLQRELSAFANPGWKELFLATMAALIADAQKQVVAVGEKTPAHISSALELLDEYPDCRIIQIVRDPRGVLSSYRGVKVGTNQAAGVIREWRRAWEKHQQLEGHPRYLQLRYEDLIRDAESELRKVCAILAVPFDPAMLAFHARTDTGFAAEQAHHSSTLKPLFHSSLEAWKAKLSARQIALVETHLAEGMAAFGYDLPERLQLVSSRALMLSESCDLVHRHLVRRPRQIAKRWRALQRLRREGGER